MKLPSVTTTLTTLVIIWCIAGVSAHGLAILAYPAAWSALCLFFVVLNKGFDVLYAPAASPVGAKRPAMADRAAGVRTEEQISAA